MKRLLSVAMLCVLAFSGSALGGDTPKKEASAKKEYNHEHRFVFYAILEGLYEDGVSDEALKLIVPDPKSMADLKDPEQTNFIPECPLCTPAFDAFCVYRARPVFVGQAASKTSTFGGGLSKETLAGLRGSPSERRETIRQLIENYIARRLEILYLDVEDREDVTLRLRELRLKGQIALARVQRGEEGEELKKVYADWKVCPNCTGISQEVKE
jgi:hypothetical protein